MENDILNSTLVTVPAAPALVENARNEFYLGALGSADFSIIDSSLFAILCRLYFIRIYKYSGFRLISDLLTYIKSNHLRVLLVDPNEGSGCTNRKYLLANTCLAENDLASYVAPVYPKGSAIEDPLLLEKIHEFKPRLILIGISGGKQEVLGHYLRRNLKFRSTIMCTGAALSFFTGEQATIARPVDRFYLGWLARIIADPKIFLPRYLRAVKFVYLFFRYRLNITY